MPCELILVLDAPSPREVLPILDRLAGTVKWVKVGMEMYTACGPGCVEEIANLGFNVFLDLKFHDIPNTVAGAVESACKLPVSMLTIHTAGGREMMKRAVAAAQRGTKAPFAGAELARTRPDVLVLGVTVLTSIDQAALAATGVSGSPADQVGRLGALAVDAGLRGLVCSPQEIGLLRKTLPKDVVLVTPGIRPRDAKADDQSRVMTPAEAAKAGANFIVVGRPIMLAADPVEAARSICNDLKSQI